MEQAVANGGIAAEIMDCVLRVLIAKTAVSIEIERRLRSKLFATDAGCP
jgi:hypothetical protein